MHTLFIFNFQSKPKVFCAGLDIMELYKAEEGRLTDFWRTFQDVFIKLYGTRIPVVAAIEVPTFICLLHSHYVKCTRLCFSLYMYMHMFTRFALTLNALVNPTTEFHVSSSKYTYLNYTFSNLVRWHIDNKIKEYRVSGRNVFHLE